MSRVVTKVSLGIAVCLSSSLLCSQSSKAVSLKIGDREKNTTLEEKLLFSSDFFSTVNNFEPNFSIQQDNQIVLDDPFDNNQLLSRLFLLDNQQLSSLYSTEKASIFESTATLFSNRILGNENQTENVSLLSYFAEAVDNIEIELTRGDTSNSEITVLSQTALQNIYEDVYSSEIDLSAPASLGTENNSISASRTTPNESLSDSPSSSNLVFFQYSPYINKVSNYDSSVSSSSLSSSNINSLINRKIGDDLSSRADALILKPTNIFTNIPEIENRSRFEFKRDNKVKRDPKMREIETQIREERERRQQEREKIREKLRREQQQRREQRQRDQERIRKERANRLRNQIRQQQQKMREQQNRSR